MPVQDRLAARTVYVYVVCLVALLVGVFAAVQLTRGVATLAGPEPQVTFVAESPVDRVEGTIPAADAEQYLSPEQRSARDAQWRTDVQETVVAGTVLVLAGALLALGLRRATAHRSTPRVPAGPPAP